MKEYIVDQSTTLKLFTDNTHPQASFYWNRLLKDKEIRVNGEKVNKDRPVKKGDRITYYLTAKQQEKECFVPVYEDENILIADKESGVNSEALYSFLCERGEYYFIHRLDRNTTGLITFAKNEKSAEELLSCFKERRVQKKYRALCFGCPKKDHDVLTAFLRKDDKTSTVSISDHEGYGEKIVTEYQVIERGEISLLEVTLHTGKTHQIRAHLSHIGCPLVGDEKYGDSKKNTQANKKRQCLNSYSISFDCRSPLQYLNGKTFYSKRKIELTEV